MFRTKAEILRGLDPLNPATVQALIDFHRRTFGGFVMEDNTGDAGKGPDEGHEGKSEQGKQDPPVDGKGGDKPLGPNGEKALQTEREARQQLEKDLKELKSSQADVAKKIAEAFGIKSEDAKSTDEVVSALQKQVSDMQHDNLVLRVAAAHKITEKDDLDLLQATADEATMTKLAARLSNTGPAKDEGSGNGQPRRFPKQDSSQGKGGSGGEGRPTSVAAVMEERAAARTARQRNA